MLLALIQGGKETSSASLLDLLAVQIEYCRAVKFSVELKGAKCNLQATQGNESAAQPHRKEAVSHY